jgi:hypothetical protein
MEKLRNDIVLKLKLLFGKPKLRKVRTHMYWCIYKTFVGSIET